VALRGHRSGLCARRGAGGRRAVRPPGIDCPSPALAARHLGHERAHRPGASADSVPFPIPQPTHADTCVDRAARGPSPPSVAPSTSTPRPLPKPAGSLSAEDAAPAPPRDTGPAEASPARLDPTDRLGRVVSGDASPRHSMTPPGASRRIRSSAYARSSPRATVTEDPRCASDPSGPSRDGWPQLGGGDRRRTSLNSRAPRRTPGLEVDYFPALRFEAE
jgi:hypothetical protein